MAVTEADLKPTSDDVALLLRTRTVGDGPAQGGLGSDTGPNEVTVFDETTRPKDTEVNAIIDTAYGAVYARLNADLAGIPLEQAPSIRHAVALYAAILVEVSFFRETANQDLIRLMREEVAETVGGVNVAIGGSQRRPSFGTLTIGTVIPKVIVRADPVPGIDT